MDMLGGAIPPQSAPSSVVGHSVVAPVKRRYIQTRQRPHANVTLREADITGASRKLSHKLVNNAQAARAAENAKRVNQIVAVRTEMQASHRRCECL